MYYCRSYIVYIHIHTYTPPTIKNKNNKICGLISKKQGTGADTELAGTDLRAKRDDHIRHSVPEVLLGLLAQHRCRGVAEQVLPQVKRQGLKVVPRCGKVQHQGWGRSLKAAWCSGNEISSLESREGGEEALDICDKAVFKS